MSKKEMRGMRRGMASAAGSADMELEELEKLQEAEKSLNSAIGTITVGCTTVFSLICC